VDAKRRLPAQGVDVKNSKNARLTDATRANHVLFEIQQKIVIESATMADFCGMCGLVQAKTDKSYETDGHAHTFLRKTE
jgi:hypothetical protein